MALQIHWANGFEDLVPVPDMQNMGAGNYKNQILGWDSEYSSYTGSPNTPTFTGITSNPHLRGVSANTNLSWSTTTPTMIPRLFRKVVDNDKMVLATAYRMALTGAELNKTAIGIKAISGDTIHVRCVNTSGSLYHIGLYINDNLVSTGTSVEIASGAPWVYIELFINKTSSSVVVNVSGVPECSGVMPVGFTADDCEITLKDMTSNYNSAQYIHFDDIVFYTGSDPLGVIKVDGFYKTGDTLTGFNDGTDGGSSSTSNINNSSFYGYRASSTAGQEDRFSYDSILPVGVQATSILAVIPSVVASSGSYNNGNLELVFVSGGTTNTVDVSSKVKPFTPNLVTGPVLQSDPDTGLPWTRSAVQSIQTGYRVKS